MDMMLEGTEDCFIDEAFMMAAAEAAGWSGE